MEVKKRYIDAIVSATQYSGSHGNERVISASALEDDILPTYLKIKYGMEKSDVISQSTLGSLLHLGVDKAFENHEDTYIAKRRKLNVSNDFILSGETDVEFYEKDKNTLHIIDNKMVKYATYEKILTGKDDAYLTQLKAYEYLAKNCDDIKYDNIKVYLSFFFKDGTLFAKKVIPDHLLVNFTNRMITDSEFEDKIDSLTTDLKMYLENENETPPECSQLFWNRRTDKAQKERCRSFCSVNSSCPYYKEQKKFYKNRHSKSIEKLLGGL
jgi:hypothetical protein